MRIQNIFQDDINRNINGVIKVDQDSYEVIEQEVREYVITKELRKHFDAFFSRYAEAFDQPTTDIGVWISGFFGSGKSHFLKMLSYILGNKLIGNTRTVEMFRSKFEGDSLAFSSIEKSTRGETEPILFNIDIKSSIHKDDTAVVKVFAKMFYEHLGYYGEDLKVVRLEQFIEENGKTAEFRKNYEEIKGKTWQEGRRFYELDEEVIVEALVKSGVTSEVVARRWIADYSQVAFSIDKLVEDIKAYVDSKPADFRLLFMIDEVGQYVGTNTSMLLNLQSLTEMLGSTCLGKVWIVCTGQEAIDEIIKVRSDEFSRIQARFKTRLSLSSSSVDEVIQKRILRKTDEAQRVLSSVYDTSVPVLRNIFTFTDAQLDIKGFSSSDEFVNTFPFVPYQFIIMQKVFAEIRKHGNSGKHLSGGERSMLSGFQEAAQKVQHLDEYTLVPFFRFYDTVHSFLDSTIRRVIERCERASETPDAGIEALDVDILKLLYLIRYIDNEVPSNLDNIIILMADTIHVDKVSLREKVRDSLDRLLSQNYIGRSGETYNFLTDEEQEIQKEISHTDVDTADIVKKIGDLIFSGIYEPRKFRYKNGFGKNRDFDYDGMVDGQDFRVRTNGMCLKFLTTASDPESKTPLQLRVDSSHHQAIFVLGGFEYYDKLELAMKIRKYVKQQNIVRKPASVQDIIRRYQEEASLIESQASEELKKAIVAARVYVAGDEESLRCADAKMRIEKAMELLVSIVYKELNLITKPSESNEDIIQILTGNGPWVPGTEPNLEAASKVEEFLEMKRMKNLPTSMADIHTHFSAIPYGWQEIDIAAVVAYLVRAQKVTIKYAGETIQPGDKSLPDKLRRKTEIGKTMVSKREIVSVRKRKEAQDFMREYFVQMGIHDDEDGLVAYIADMFRKLRAKYEDINRRYSGHSYPGQALVTAALKLVDDVLSQTKDNTALIDRVLSRRKELLDNKEALHVVVSFFDNQVGVFDAAENLIQRLRQDNDYLETQQEAKSALQSITEICYPAPGTPFAYNRIPELNALMDSVRAVHESLLQAKRADILEMVRQCMQAIHAQAKANDRTQKISNEADSYFLRKKQEIASMASLALLDGLQPQLILVKDNTLRDMEAASRPTPPRPQPNPQLAPQPEKPKKSYTLINRSIVFPARKLESEADVDAYVEDLRKILKRHLANADGGIVLK